MLKTSQPMLHVHDVERLGLLRDREPAGLDLAISRVGVERENPSVYPFLRRACIEKTASRKHGVVLFEKSSNAAEAGTRRGSLIAGVFFRQIRIVDVDLRSLNDVIGFHDSRVEDPIVLFE